MRGGRSTPASTALDRVDELSLDDKERGTRVAEDVGELEAAQRGIDRDRDGTKPRAAEIDLQELRTVRTHQRNPIARPDPGIHERLGRRGRDRRGLRKAPARLTRDKQDTLAIALGLPGEDR